MNFWCFPLISSLTFSSGWKFSSAMSTVYSCQVWHSVLDTHWPWHMLTYHGRTDVLDCLLHFLAAVSCVVSEWTQWSGCAEPCRATVRRRSRIVLQEPLNAGKPCPHLEEHAGCAEYWSKQGHCPNSLGRENPHDFIFSELPLWQMLLKHFISLQTQPHRWSCVKYKIITKVK